MITDILHYDLLDLVSGTNWPEKDQANLVLGYTKALQLHLLEKLSPYFDGQTEQEFLSLQQDPDLTPEKITEFYETKIPHLRNVLDQFTMFHKRSFLLKFYENMVQSVYDDMEKNKHEYIHYPNDSISMYQWKLKEKELNIWLRIQHFAQKDDWHRVIQAIKPLIGPPLTLEFFE